MKASTYIINTHNLVDGIVRNKTFGNHYPAGSNIIHTLKNMSPISTSNDTPTS